MASGYPLQFMAQIPGSFRIEAPPVYHIEHASGTNFLVISVKCVITLNEAVTLTSEILLATLIRSWKIFRWSVLRFHGVHTKSPENR
jgi:hypothetical protein